MIQLRAEHQYDNHSYDPFAADADSSPLWMFEAACADVAPDVRDLMFFSEKRQAEGIALCYTCPVRVECYDAGAGEEFGVWGGVPADQRKRPRRAWHTTVV